ncbi:hypothetical protein [Robiginitomaculum antarcticum]|uniref:hypothetical protein n=1 Tax=Robiginitomaculum antarcticum TaxID=437507 RepID=UPI00037F651B|nr:hypothetical protein [Robiginitomaculum antarcticum]
MTQIDPKPRASLAGKIVVLGMGFAMVLAYFLMESQGIMAQRRVLIPFAITLVIALAAMYGAMHLATKMNATRRGRMIISSFFIMLILIMALAAFYMSGIGF